MSYQSSSSSGSESDRQTGELCRTRKRRSNRHKRRYRKRDRSPTKRQRSADSTESKGRDSERAEPTAEKNMSELPESEQYKVSRCSLKPPTSDVLSLPNPLSHSSLLERRRRKHLRALFRLPSNETSLSSITSDFFVRLRRTIGVR